MKSLIHNTNLSITSINSSINKNLIYSDYGLFNKNINVFTHAVIPTPYSENPISFGTVLSLEQINRAKINADNLGLLVDAQYTNTEITSDVYLTLPVEDTSQGAYTLLNLLNLKNKGDQCILKFSRFGSNINANEKVFLGSFSGSNNNVLFNVTEISWNALIFDKNSGQPYTLVVAEALNTQNLDYKIIFRIITLANSCVPDEIKRTRTDKPPKLPPGTTYPLPSWNRT